MTQPPTVTERPSITPEELDEFFNERNVHGECPSCGANNWISSVPIEDNQLGGLAALATDAVSRLQWNSYVPSIGLTCQNCGFIRMLSWGVLELWKNSRKPKA